ncbi:S8 family serine peptidase [Haloarcula salina]|uniref:S8 family serine peptidase n=1 Tax=Haloarcula salina TaxID=1429914 RepID=A0AA41FZZ6_9EURY|nr:S8 family serine peptidase [Haloarcula salina]MBV0901695.1 S8 family serine peptidase [Haloarcula salina]
MRERSALVAASLAVLALTAGIGALATTSLDDPDASPSSAGRSSADGASSGRFAALHAAGVTGENVSVGVVDPTGFDVRRGGLRPHVAETRAFGTRGLRAGDDDHGTAAARVLARTAPDANLYLARVDGVDSYRRAVDWLLAEGVDVIVAPVAFYGQPGDGTGPVARATTRAANEGVLFVAPTGNLAESHWSGRYDGETAANGTVLFANDSRRNFVRGDTEMTVWLSWGREGRNEDYTAELYRTNGTVSRLVARSQPYRADAVPNERIVADVEPGRYYLVVHGPSEPTGTRVRLVSPTHEFQHAVADGSVVAPGTARGAVTVGAYNTRVDRVEPYSSRGPTADGRTGVDLVAPDRRFADASSSEFVGSSAAVPYVGGTAALLLDADPTLSPRRAALLLELTARDVGRPGIDAATGHGEVAPDRAVRAATNESAT